MNKPKISIIIPCYNMGNFIDEAIQSVQKYPDDETYEIIVVNDGSDEPSTVKKLEEIETRGIRVIHQENKGLGNARNTGIEAAKAEYILPLDADNKILTEYILSGIELLENNTDIDIVYGNALFFGDENKINQVSEFSIEALLNKNYIDACAVYRKKAWETVGGYDEHMPTMGWEDWDFWLRAFFKGFKFKHIDKVLYEYRVRHDSMIQTTKNHQEELVDYIFNKPELSDAKDLRNSFQQLYDIKNFKDTFYKSFEYSS